MDCYPLGSSVPGISQARILEWVAISLSRGIELASPALAAGFLHDLLKKLKWISNFTGKLKEL